MYKFAFIGAGNMGGAIIQGFVSNGVCSPGDIIVSDVNEDTRERFAAIGCGVAQSVADAVSSAEYCFLALKPGISGKVLESIGAECANINEKVFISIMASVPTSFICEKLGADVPCVRTMPNTPLMIGMGAVAVSRNCYVPAKKFEFVCQSLSRVAVITLLDEDKMNRIISINGSSPAYVYLFVKGMLDSAEKQGIEKEKAMPLILRTIEGAIKMIKKSDGSLEELIAEVCAPNGTTIEAVRSFEKDAFTDIIDRAMQACTRRADEITEEIQ